MFLISTPYCRCHTDKHAPFSISDAPVDPDFYKIFRDMRCTKCDDGFITNSYKSAAVPEGRVRFLLTGLIKPSLYKLRFAPFAITDIRHGATHGDCGAPTCTISLESRENAGHCASITWTELVGSMPPEPRLITDNAPPVMAEVYKFAQFIGFTNGLVEGRDRNKPWAYTDTKEETPSLRYSLRLLLAWNETNYHR